MRSLSPRRAGLALTLFQATLLLALGGSYLVDRIRLPRAWVRVAPVDPELPIRGRYVSLVPLVPSPTLSPPTPPRRSFSRAVRLRAEGGRLVAYPTSAEDTSGPRPLPAKVEWSDGALIARLDQPIAFFLPSGAADPSRRARGEELWVEVNLPSEGMPRPLRLGVRRVLGGQTGQAGQGIGGIEPLRLD